MAEQFNIDEIFEIAEQMERNGAKFYRRAAEYSISDDARSLLLRLAEMEVEHERVFAVLREDASRDRPAWLAWLSGSDGGNEAALYLCAIAEGRVFDLRSDPTDTLTGKEGLADILRIAIGLEKDSIVFYLGVKEAVPEKLGRDKMDAIIKEELGHVATLTQELAALQG